MNAIYRTKDGDMIDRISWLFYGDEHGTINILEANPNLSFYSEFLPANITIILPPLNITPEPVIKLWD